MKKDKRVDLYLETKSDKQDILKLLRELVLSTELKETLKWGMPVYTLEGKNVVGIAAFKNYAALWFYQGALLKDKDKHLINAQEGKTQALRQWHFRTIAEVNEPLVKTYLEEAMANQKAGKQIKVNRNKELVIPAELKLAMEQDPQLYAAFAQLSPGRQREYAEFISGAKHAATRVKRLEKCVPLMMGLKGLNDQYK